jgi:K(+)-stimulated pyrophosphate-energized sodium pump
VLLFSAIAGNIGMRIATAANVRTAEAARTSLSKALNVSFTGGAVMGLGVAGLSCIWFECNLRWFVQLLL